MIRVTRYNRYWSVWRGEELIAVTVYRKGAMAVAALINRMEAQP
jgi:hypothetical protein